MKKQFQWDKFIPDCFLCIFLMPISIIAFFIPAGLIVKLIRKFLFYIFDSTSYYLRNVDILNDFFFIALCLTLCHIFFFGIWFFLEKKGLMIKYKIYKSSFWIVFILLTSFWWLEAYGLATTGK
ncbi:hypothetical protein [Helicobacter sp. MIT 14-3879]|uniref:hypothetical protein n=1 Tax=Helicobacter sp. MIT 14-3879 TaxID=2040649 RepID=UPI000E1F001C|nr:hypothetical protein [Helicobacter sp. MIT 14-3879]RDU59033.1 hypothetical protein CQA44_11795 [Helicobacter sp. MIT 14-3879]